MKYCIVDLKYYVQNQSKKYISCVFWSDERNRLPLRFICEAPARVRIVGPES